MSNTWRIDAIVRNAESSAKCLPGHILKRATDVSRAIQLDIYEVMWQWGYGTFVRSQTGT